MLPILRSAAVGEILARLYLAPARAWTLSELGGDTGISLPTLTREATGMVRAGLLLEERVGRTRQVRCNAATRAFRPLQELLALTYGPVPVLQEQLRQVPGVEEDDTDPFLRHVRDSPLVALDLKGDSGARPRAATGSTSWWLTASPSARSSPRWPGTSGRRAPQLR